MPRLGLIWHCCVSDGVPRRSLAIALIVGSVLNLINQGDVLFGSGHVDLMKLMLTFLVPYFVATYGAVSFRLRVAHRIADSDSRDVASARAQADRHH
jgi:hypothetical protein